MIQSDGIQIDDEKAKQAAESGFARSELLLNAKHDKVFAILFACQYILGIVFALTISPLSWIGNQSSINFHVYTAIILGGLIAVGPILLIWQSPGRKLNQWIIALSQMLFSTLFIHLTGGRIETHFHIFGSLAFLSFYRDFRIITFATTITIADHFLRGSFWPESIYGVVIAGPWRALEHGAWVIFEDVVLYFSVKYNKELLYNTNLVTAKLNFNYENIESLVKSRTSALIEANRTIVGQQQSLQQSAKFSALGEMAGGIAHEINNPLTVIAGISILLRTKLEKGVLTNESLSESLSKIDKTVLRITKTIKGLKTFSRDSVSDEMDVVQVLTIINDTVELCSQKIKMSDVDLKVDCPADYNIKCRSTQISQIILNLIGNSIDALEPLTEKWIHIKVEPFDKKLKIFVTDSGGGIPKDIADKMMKPFFTTKELGKGTGLGLSISGRIAEANGGVLSYDETSTNTCFVLEMPMHQVPSLT